MPVSHTPSETVWKIWGTCPQSENILFCCEDSLHASLPVSQLQHESAHESSFSDSFKHFPCHILTPMAGYFYLHGYFTMDDVPHGHTEVAHAGGTQLTTPIARLCFQTQPEQAVPLWESPSSHTARQEYRQEKTADIYSWTFSAACLRILEEAIFISTTKAGPRILPQGPGDGLTTCTNLEGNPGRSLLLPPPPRAGAPPATTPTVVRQSPRSS